MKKKEWDEGLFRAATNKYLGYEWPIRLIKHGTYSDEITSKSQLPKKLDGTAEFRNSNIGLVPKHAGLIAFRTYKHSRAIQEILNVFKLKNESEALIKTMRIEGPAGENVWLWKVPPDLIERQIGKSSSKPMQFMPSVRAVYTGTILLPPSEAGGCSYHWNSLSVTIKTLPESIAALTGYFISREKTAKMLSKFKGMTERSLKDADSVLRVRKGAEIMQELYLSKYAEDFYDALSETFERLEDLTSAEGMLVAVKAMPLWNTVVVGQRAVFDICQRYHKRDRKKHDSYIQMDVRHEIISNESNCIEIIKGIYGDRVYTDKRTGGAMVEGRELNTNVVTEFMVRAQRKYRAKFGSNVASRSIRYVASLNERMPPIEKIRATAWDGKDRIDRLMSVYLGSEPCKYSNDLSRYVLLKSIEAISLGVPQMSAMPVFTGAHADVALTSLFGELPMLDVPHHSYIRGKWVVGFNMACVDAQMTEFMARKDDGGNANRLKRYCMFVGLSPDRDVPWRQVENLGSDIVVIDVGTDFKLLAQDSRQILAEALHRFEAGDRVSLKAGCRLSVDKIRNKQARSDPLWKPVVRYASDKMLSGLSITMEDIFYNIGIMKPTKEQKEKVDGIMQSLGAEKLKDETWYRGESTH